MMTKKVFFCYTHFIQNQMLKRKTCGLSTCTITVHYTTFLNITKPSFNDSNFPKLGINSPQNKLLPMNAIIKQTLFSKAKLNSGHLLTTGMPYMDQWHVGHHIISTSLHTPYWNLLWLLFTIDKENVTCRPEPHGEVIPHGMVTIIC